MPRKRTVIQNPDSGSLPKPPETPPAAPLFSDPLYKSPEEMEQVKANLERLASQTTEEKPEKRGRKKKTEPVEKSAEELKKEQELKETAEDFALIGTQLLIFGVQSLPDPTPPSESEKLMFNRALNRCMLKWIPAMDKWGAEIALVASCAVIAVPRLQKPKPKKQEVDS